MDDQFSPTSFLVGAVTALICCGIGFAQLGTPRNTAYTKGITDCQQGTTSYTVTVGPEGVDTTYVYKP